MQICTPLLLHYPTLCVLLFGYDVLSEFCFHLVTSVYRFVSGPSILRNKGIIFVCIFFKNRIHIRIGRIVRKNRTLTAILT